MPPLDAWQLALFVPCRVDGCNWRVLADEDDRTQKCRAHGGDPMAAFCMDEWGEHDRYYRRDVQVAVGGFLGPK